MADIYDLHIETLKMIDLEMARLHQQIAAGDGMTAEAQDQLEALQNELIRLSEAFSNKECE